MVVVLLVVRMDSGWEGGRNRGREESDGEEEGLKT